jgi:hypothetical protein
MLGQKVLHTCPLILASDFTGGSGRLTRFDKQTSRMRAARRAFVIYGSGR